MRRLPDFIIAGARKCGTTWLHRCLSEHPQIFVPLSAKELFFFDRLWDRGVDWYSRYFQEALSSQICGESTPSYFSHPGAAARIHATIPDVKLIFIFRNPIDRAISMYHHMISVGETRDSFSETAARMPYLIEEGFYDRLYDEYQRIFGTKALFPMILEDFQQPDEASLRPLFRFLGVSTEFHPPSLFERTYARREVRNQMLVGWIGRATLFFRDHGLHSVVNVAKYAGAERLFYKKNPSPLAPLEPDLILRLKENYIEDVRRFGNRIGRNLLELWGLHS